MVDIHANVVRRDVEEYLERQLSDHRLYICGHCGVSVEGWVVGRMNYSNDRLWLLCTSCGKGSVVNDDIIFPPPRSFRDMKGLPEAKADSVGIKNLYDEARKSFDAQAYAGCEMLCRTLLMYVAVEKGAEQDRNFRDYVDYLKSEGYITKPLNAMANKVRDNGNKAVHEVKIPDMARAKYTLKFTHEILRQIYETSHILKEYDDSNNVNKVG